MPSKDDIARLRANAHVEIEPTVNRLSWCALNLAGIACNLARNQSS